MVGGGHLIQRVFSSLVLGVDGVASVVRGLHEGVGRAWIGAWVVHCVLQVWTASIYGFNFGLHHGAVAAEWVMRVQDVRVVCLPGFGCLRCR